MKDSLPLIDELGTISLIVTGRVTVSVMSIVLLKRAETEEELSRTPLGEDETDEFSELDLLGCDEVLIPPDVDERSVLDSTEECEGLHRTGVDVAEPWELEDCAWLGVGGVYTTTGEDDVSTPPAVDDELGIEVCEELAKLDELALFGDA